MKGTLVLPVPVYPSNIVTDASLKVAANQVATTLTTKVSSLDTLFRVSDTSRLVVDMLLTIDNEIVSVSAIDHASHIVTVVRGFDGTVPTSHNAGRLLQAFIDAWHHNSLAAEVKAIEAALGPNLSNITGSTAIVSRNYAWLQSPGGNLVVGNNMITLTPVPRGVNGSNQNHYVYVSGGTGAAEACLITGGTAVSGADTGTLIINCANAHSGFWTVGTATAGIQEAVHVSAGSGIPIQIPEGNNVINATTTIPYTTALRGYGMGLSRIISGPSMTTQHGFVFWGAGLVEYSVVEDLMFFGIAGQTQGFAILVNTHNYFKAERVYIYTWPSGVYFNNAHISQLTDVYVFDPEDVTGIGVHIQGLSSYVTRLDRVVVQGNTSPGGTSQPLAGLRIRQVADVIVKDCHFMVCKNGMLIDPSGGMGVSSVKCVATYFDNSWGNGVLIQPGAGSGVYRTEFLSCWFSDSKAGWGLLLTDSEGGDINGVMVDECQFYRNSSSGMLADGGGAGTVLGVRVNGSVFSGNSNATPNTASGAVFNCNDWMFTNNRSGPADGFGNSQAYGLFVFSAANNSYTITGNDLSGNMTGGLADNGEGMSKVVRNNRGVSDKVATMASAATLNLGAAGVEVVKITGTTAISTITGGWEGREVTLIFTQAGHGGLVTGGNIGRAQTAALFQSIRLNFDSAFWY